MKDIAKQLMNKKGQALVEFVLLLPILIFIIFIIIDFATIFYNKNHLEGIINDVSLLVKSDTSKEDIIKIIDNSNIEYTIFYDDRYSTIKLTQKINLITPFSDLLFDNPYIISSERKIIYE